MKRHIIIMALAIPFFYGCNEAATTEKTEVEAEVITNIEVIEPVNEPVVVDSVAVEMDQVKTEIDESAEKVDELLNEL